MKAALFAVPSSDLLCRPFDVTRSEILLAVGDTYAAALNDELVVSTLGLQLDK